MRAKAGWWRCAISAGSALEGDSRGVGDFRRHREPRLAVGSELVDPRDESRSIVNSQPAWDEIERLYNEALELPLCERKALLARASPELRAEVESLLEADASTGLLAAPPTQIAADLLDGQPGGLRAGQRVADYEVESLISIGGMGEVYLARNTAGLPVALKILRRHLIVNPQAVDRFETEARAASALRHPNIVTVYESGKSVAGLFIAMEWIAGSTLRAIMDAGRTGIRRKRRIGAGKPREPCLPRTRRESSIAM